MDDLADLEARLRSLLKGQYSSLTLSFNDAHACNYETAEKWYSEGSDNGLAEFVSPEEREKAIAENSVWTMQWYPNTPVGFHAIAASSLPALIDGLEKASA